MTFQMFIRLAYRVALNTLLLNPKPFYSLNNRRAHTAYYCNCLSRSLLRKTYVHWRKRRGTNFEAIQGSVDAGLQSVLAKLRFIPWHRLVSQPVASLWKNHSVGYHGPGHLKQNEFHIHSKGGIMLVSFPNLRKCPKRNIRDLRSGDAQRPAPVVIRQITMSFSSHELSSRTSCIEFEVRFDRSNVNAKKAYVATLMCTFPFPVSASSCPFAHNSFALLLNCVGHCMQLFDTEITSKC